MGSHETLAQLKIRRTEISVSISFSTISMLRLRKLTSQAPLSAVYTILIYLDRLLNEYQIILVSINPIGSKLTSNRMFIRY